jgi:DNA processing protein
MNEEYWIWLQSALNYASAKPIRVLEYYSSAKEFFDAGVDAWKNMKLFSLNELTALKGTPLSDARKTIETCEKNNFKILTPEDEGYPKRLLRITTPPAVLYVKGSIDNIDDEVVVTMVGTRNSTVFGNKTAAILSYRLAEGGAIVLSGGAKGIDTHCHLGALEAKGRTVVALGCGLLYPYLPENHEMRCKAAETGAVITEYQPHCGASRFTFPQRNRIMAALSLATVIIEAGNKSGALITADQALEYGKDIFVIPGSVMEKEYKGNNKLLRDGATAIYSATDILSEYICEYPHRLSLKNSGIPIGEDNIIDNISVDENVAEKPPQKPKKSIIKPKNQKIQKTSDEFVKVEAPEMVSSSAKKVYESFTTSQMSLDIIIATSSLTTSEALRAITELELFGLVEAKPGNQYALLKREER